MDEITTDPNKAVRRVLETSLLLVGSSSHGPTSKCFLQARATPDERAFLGPLAGPPSNAVTGLRGLSPKGFEFRLVCLGLLHEENVLMRRGQEGPGTGPGGGIRSHEAEVANFSPSHFPLA